MLSGQKTRGNWRKILVYVAIVKVSNPFCFQEGKEGVNVIASFWRTPRLVGSVGELPDGVITGGQRFCWGTYEKVQIAYSASIQLPSLLVMVTPSSL